MKIVENNKVKRIISDTCNCIFNKETGMTFTWGRTLKENATYCKYGPLLLDIEITTICNNGCPFCYKSNTPDGKNMSFETFIEILDSMPPTVMQIAFGVDATCESNPDIWRIMHYCREKSIIPNVTVADITPNTADKLVSVCGAVAVSRYANKNICYDSVKLLTDRGLKQTNIHIMVSEQTSEDIYTTFKDYMEDERLRKLNAIVLLSLKKKGRGEGFDKIKEDKFNDLVRIATDGNIPIGFDSCTASKFMKAVHGNKKYDPYVESCESTLQSAYIDVDGNYYPCSFCEGVVDGISTLNSKDFVKDVWNNKQTVEFREKLLGNVDENRQRMCPIWEV